MLTVHQLAQLMTVIKFFLASACGVLYLDGQSDQEVNFSSHLTSMVGELAVGMSENSEK